MVGLPLHARRVCCTLVNMGPVGKLLWVCLFVTAAAAQGPRIELVKVAGGFSRPTHLTHAGDGSGRLFVVEQPGRIRILRNGVVLPSPFLDLTDRVSCCGERGLLSVAFPPGYSAKKHFYVYYTARSGDITIARYRTSDTPDLADPASETVVLTIAHRQFSNHNGGQLAFGPDGFLYIGAGDGGGAGDPLRSGQSTSTLLGKLLRIDVESGASPYSIPAGNPFANRPGSRPEIWAYGLRNPWRFSFDRATRDLYIADVGQNLYEEINFQPVATAGGQNYGWNTMEGRHCFQSGCSTTGLVLPVTEYNHSAGDCSVTGGFVYRGARYPALQGIYFYADYCTGRLWSLSRRGPDWQSSELRTTGLAISSFGEDEAGELYLVDQAGSAVYRLAAAGLSVVNAASFELGLVPGSIASVFGPGITSAAGTVQAGQGALPRELGGVSLTLNGIAAPLYAVANVNGDQQVNFQVPYELAASSRASVVVSVNGTSRAPVEADVLAAQPALFTLDGIHAATLHASDYGVVDAANPAAAGEILLLYATGLGAVENPPGTGQLQPVTPLSRTLTQPQVTIGSRNAAVLFSGLAPGFAGLYQLNVQVPSDLPAGEQEVLLALAGSVSKPSKITVR